MVTVWIVLSITLFWLLAHPQNVPRWIVLLLFLYCLAISNYLGKIFIKDYASIVQMAAEYLFTIIPPVLAAFLFARPHILKVVNSLLISFVILIPFSKYPSSVNERITSFENHFSHTDDSEAVLGSCDFTNGQFAALPAAQRASTLEACRAARNPSFIPNAIALVDHPDEALALNAALYLEAVTGEKLGADRERWQIYQKSKSSRLNTSLHVTLENPNSELVDKGFSAVMIVDAFETGQEIGKDFLILYLQMRHGTPVTQKDLTMLRERAAHGASKCSGESNCFRLGMNYFLLAFGETLNIAQGNSVDAATVQSHWEHAVNTLEQTRELGAPIAAATQKILKAADTNNDGHLSSSELANIIHSRL